MSIQQLMLAQSASPSGGAAPVFVVAQINGIATGAALSRAWTTGYAAGDLGILVVQSDNVAPTTPSGWDLLAQAGAGTPGAALSTMLSVYGRIAATSSEPAASVGRNGGFLQGRMFVFRGAAASGYAEDAATAFGATSGTISLPSVTTSGDNRLILYIIADGTDSGSSSRYSGWANANLASITPRGDAGTTTLTGGGYSLANGVKNTAGAIGAGSVAFGLSASNYAAATIAIRP